jgi:outer membrane protein
VKLRNITTSLAARLALAGAASLSLAGVAAAQQPAARPAAPAAPAQQPAARPAGGPFPGGHVAIIYVPAFQTQVAELKRAIEGLNTRFEARTKELQGLGDQISGIENQVKQGTVTPAQQAQLAERYEQLKREYTRKSEDLQAEAQKAYATSTDPIRTKLSDALKKYAADHQIVLIIEIGRAMEIGQVFYAAANVNITDDFIATYNKANP